MGNKLKITENQLRKLIQEQNESEVNEVGLGLGFASIGAQKAAEDVAKMLMSLDPQFVGPEQEGGIKSAYMDEFCKHLNNIILGQDNSTEQMAPEPDSNTGEEAQNYDDMDSIDDFKNQMSESVEKLKSQFKRFL